MDIDPFFGVGFAVPSDSDFVEADSVVALLRRGLEQTRRSGQCVPGGGFCDLVGGGVTARDGACCFGWSQYPWCGRAKAAAFCIGVDRDYCWRMNGWGKA